MLTATFAFALYALCSTAYSSSQLAPECVTKCWTYSQYVSLSCAGNTKCLCEDAEFQNAVYQCLYSQCSTSKFGTALHHALGYCAGQESNPASPTVVLNQASPMPTAGPGPALIRNEALKKRGGGAMMSVSNSVTRTRHPSVSANAFMHAKTRAVVADAHEPTAAAIAQNADGHPHAPPNAVYRMANDRFHLKYKAAEAKRDEVSKDL